MVFLRSERDRLGTVGADVWETISKRDWTKHKQNGVGVMEKDPYGNYLLLWNVLNDSWRQAANGKGKDRHQKNNEPIDFFCI